MFENEYFYYTAFGLTIKSEIAFSELFALESGPEQIDINICLGKVPEKETIIGFQKPITAYNKNEYWQIIPGVAKYYAKNGNSIIIEPITENWSEIRLFLINNIFYSVLYQNSFLPFLASGIIDKNGEVVLFMAPFLSGKSTLLLQFINKGFLPFTDNICVFNISDKNSILVNNSFKMIYTWKNTLESLKFNFLKVIEIRENINKIGILNENIKCSEKKIRAIIILKESKKASDLTIKKLTQTEAFLKLHECHARSQWLQEMDMEIENFKYSSSISKNISIYTVERPYGKDTFDAYFDLIINSEVFK
jgi:hypothetical protein